MPSDKLPGHPQRFFVGTFRLRPIALFPEVQKKETLLHNQNIYLDMALNFFSPSSGKHKYPSDFDKKVHYVIK